MAPFSVLARQRPEKHFPSLTEAAILLSLEKVCAMRDEPYSRFVDFDGSRKEGRKHAAGNAPYAVR